MVQNLEGLLTALLDCAASGNVNGGDNTDSTTSSSSTKVTRDAIANSLFTVGIKQPESLLKSVHVYLLQHPKALGSTRSFVLSIVGQVLQHVLDDVDEELALLMINLATQEMTMIKDGDDEWQSAASDVIVSLAKRFCPQVMDTLLQKFQPGMPPHRYVMITIGSIAIQNVYGFVPFLSDVLSRTLPILSTVKSDQMRSAIAVAIRQFSESICEYCSNIDDAPDKTITRENFADQMESVYDALLLWLQTKDYKVRAEIAECLGELCRIISPSRMHEELRKLIGTLIGLYRRPSVEAHVVTQGMCRLLEAACADETCPLESYLEEILVALFPQICVETNYANQANVRNQNEVLRCFHVAASRFADRLVYYLLQKMQGGNENHRLGAISVLRHLINASGQHIEDKRSLVILGLKPTLAEQSSIRVKKAMCQLSIALADHGYVDGDGGEQVIAFLVRNLVPADESTGNTKKQQPLSEADLVAASQLRAQCALALHTIANTCSVAHRLLWPYLFEFVCVESFTSALTDLFKCLAILARRTIDAGDQLDFVKGFNDNPRVAGPHQVFCRLIVAMGAESIVGDNRRKREAIRLIRLLAEWFHPAIVSTIESRCDQIEKSIDDLNSSSLTTSAMKRKQKRWEEDVLKLLATCVTAVNEGDWRSQLAAVMGKQLSLYNNYADEKHFLLRCLGGVLSKIANASYIVDHIDLMFRAVNHANLKERQGCASAIGYCASVHTELVLTQMENIAKWEHQRKSGGFFGFIKDSMPIKSYSDQEMINLRATIMLAYGYLVFYCPIDIVTQRLENPVLRFLKPYFESSKQDVIVRESLLSTIALIGHALHPSHLNTTYVFSERQTLCNYIREYVQTENADTLTSSVRILAAKAIASLAKLDPPLAEKDVRELCTVLAAYTIPLDSFKLTSRPTCSYDENEVGIARCIAAMQLAFAEIVRKQSIVSTVTTILMILQPYYSSQFDFERDRAVDATVFVLKTYFENATDCALGRASDFVPLSSLLARLVPRCADILPSVRLSALRAIRWTFRLTLLHKGMAKDCLVDDQSATSKIGIDDENEIVEAKDVQQLLRSITRVADAIELRLPKSQMQTYLSGLFEMIVDRQVGVSCSAAILLQKSLTFRGAQLINEAETLISTILSKLPEVHASSIQTYTEVLSALVALANHQLTCVLDILLRQPLPYSQTTSDVWHTMCREHSLLPQIVDHILEMSTSAGDCAYDLIDSSAIKYVHGDICALIAALNEIIKGGEPEDAIVERIAPLISATLFMLGAVVDTHFPMQQTSHNKSANQPTIITVELRRSMSTPAALALQTFKSLLFRIRADSIIQALNETNCWKEFVDSVHFVDALSIVARSIADSYPQWVRPLAEIYESRLDTPNEPYRTVSIAALAAFVRRHPNANGNADADLLDLIVKMLLKGMADTSLRIRKLSVHGMGDLAMIESEQFDKYSTTALSAAMAGLEDAGDRKDEVALEAINGLNKLSVKLPKKQLESILVNVLLRLRPCFEKESGALRAVSFSLFGELAKVGDCDVYREQLHTNLVSLLLHLNDEEEQVKMMCARSLIFVTPLLNSDEMEKLIRTELAPNECCRSYHTFLKDICAILILAYPDRVNYYALGCNNYFKSVSSRMRANAAYMTGYLLGVLSPELRSTISKELLFAGLILLLKDTETEVKVAAADAIACLYAYN